MPRQNIGRSTRKTIRTRNARKNLPTEQRTQRTTNNRLEQEERRRRARANTIDVNRQFRNRTSFNGSAFAYDPQIDYGAHNSVCIGKMNNVCGYCNALKFKNESLGMCCSSGKVKLPHLNAPPEPLLTLLSGDTQDSKHFLKNIRYYNECFQMTSFGATNIIRDNCNTTFKIQGQIYHRAGSLLPLPDAQHKFLQIYFMGNSNEEVDQRDVINRQTKRHIIQSLQALFHEHNELIGLFKIALERMPSDNYKIVIRADKRPTAEHERRYNAPTIDEVAVVIVGEQIQNRDIILHRRTDNMQRVAETHRSYDALQYPVLFCYGEDGYHFNLKLINSLTGIKYTNLIFSIAF